jgi:hypothetical protein
MHDLIGYDEIIENSMRLVIYETLKKVQNSSIPGKHYFVVTFLTRLPGVNVPKHLLEKYPDEMTIVIQFQFRNLKADHDSFSISLSFNGNYETLKIPYKAVTSFSDPSMNFTLKFSVNYDASEDLEQINNLSSSNDDKNTNIDVSAKVVSLADFRKNKKTDNKS